MESVFFTEGNEEIMKRKIVQIFLGMMLVFIACGCGKEIIEDRSSYVDEWKDREEEKEDPEDEKESKDKKKEDVDFEEENQNTTEEKEKKKRKSLQIQVATHNSQETVEDDSGQYGYTTLCTVSWQNLILDEESAKEYPQLAETLIERNRQMEESYQSMKEELMVSAMEIYEYGRDYYTPLNSSSAYYVERADENILSIRVDSSDYWGGAHGMYSSVGVNYNVNTGEELTLTDVLKSTEELPALLCENIVAQFPEEKDVFDTLEVTLEGYTPENYSWTMGYDGITFYFQPYEIAYYAMGLIKATISFDEMPELFQKEYTQSPQEGYCTALAIYKDYTLDLDSEDGAVNNLWLSEHYDTTEEIEYGLKRLSITLDDMVYIEPDVYGFEVNPYLVCIGSKENKKYYLYVETIAENDYETLSVYDLNHGGIALSGRLYGTGFAGMWKADEGEYGVYYQNVLLRPQEIQLTTKLDILGSWWGVKNYQVNEEDGMPQPDSKYYEIWGITQATTSKIPLEVTMLPLRNKKELPAGTNFYAIRTDGETFVDWRLDNGKECRTYVERDEWYFKINGIDEYDCFETLLYAG